MSDTNNSQSEQRRKHFRLVYPPAYAPTIKISGHRFFIIDLSEQGIRFYNPFRIRMPEDIFSGEVQLHEGPPIKVVGRVIRITPTDVALSLIRGVPYKTIMDEQLYLMKVSR